MLVFVFIWYLIENVLNKPIKSTEPACDHGIWSDAIVSFCRRYEMNLYFLSRPIKVFLQIRCYMLMNDIESYHLKKLGRFLRNFMLSFYSKWDTWRCSNTHFFIMECVFLQSRYIWIIDFFLCPLITWLWNTSDL